MSLRTFCRDQSHLTPLFFAVLLCLGYFNYSFLAAPISIFFHVSSITGKVLVNKFITVCNCFLEIIRLTYLFFQVLYEDSLIFLKDATDKLTFVIFLIKQFCSFVEDFGWNIINGVIHLGETIWGILMFIYYSVVTAKEGIQFVGFTIWNFFKNLPEIILCNVYGFFEFILNTLDEFKKSIFKVQDQITDSLEKTYIYLFHFPLDSVYGLIIGAVLLMILCVKFKDICYFLTSAFVKLYRQFVSIGVNLWSGRFFEQKTRRPIENHFDDDERLCIVCQYNLKEVIIFPCKHLCLCGDCSSHLTETRPICPICRSDIVETVKVYL